MWVHQKIYCLKKKEVLIFHYKCIFSNAYNSGVNINQTLYSENF